MFEIEDIIAIILNNLTIGETLELIDRLQNTEIKEWRRFNEEI